MVARCVSSRSSSRLTNPPPRRAPFRLPFVELGPRAARGREQLLPQRVEDDPVLDPAPMTHSDRHREMGKPVDEVRGAVQRVDDPFEVAAPVRTAFFGEKGVVGMTPANGVDNPPLRDPVDVGDEVVRRLLRNGERVEAIDVACDDVARLSGGADCDIQ